VGSADFTPEEEFLEFTLFRAVQKLLESKLELETLFNVEDGAVMGNKTELGVEIVDVHC